MLNSTGARTHPCLTPVHERRQTLVLLLSPQQSLHHETVEDVDEFVGAAKPEKDPPQKFSLDSAEGFGEVNKGHEQVLMLFLA